jgi:hypothetical protein
VEVLIENQMDILGLKNKSAELKSSIAIQIYKGE